MKYPRVVFRRAYCLCLLQVLLGCASESTGTPTEFEPCNQASGQICTFLDLSASSGEAEGEGASPSGGAPLPTDLTGGDWLRTGEPSLAIAFANLGRVLITESTRVTDGDPNQVRAAMAYGSSADPLTFPTDVGLDADGGLVVADRRGSNVYSYLNQLQDGEERQQLAGLCDPACTDDTGGPTLAGETSLALPSSLALHPDGRIFIAEAGCGRIRVLDPRGASSEITQPLACVTPVQLLPAAAIETLAGRIDCAFDPSSGLNSCDPIAGYEGDGGAAREAVFNTAGSPDVVDFGIALSREQEPRYLYVADSRNHVIRRIDLVAQPPVIELFAGDPDSAAPDFVDGDRLTEARFSRPANVYVSVEGDVYVADTLNHAVRRIDATSGLVTTVAGDGEPGFNGDNQPAPAARLNGPQGVWLHPDGRLFIADTLNSRVRVVLP